LRVEDLGLGHDVDDDSGHGGSLLNTRGRIPRKAYLSCGFIRSRRTGTFAVREIAGGGRAAGTG
jgi:hypothetical protein